MTNEVIYRIDIKLSAELLFADLLVDIDNTDLFFMKARIKNSDIWLSWMKGTGPDEYHS